MLAASAGALTLLRYPVLATPKLDGIRVLTLDPNYPLPQVSPSASLKSHGVTRRLNMVPNQYISTKLNQECPPGLDGELITGVLSESGDKLIPHKFNLISSDVMSQDGWPTFQYIVFDYGHNYTLEPPFPNPPYVKRLKILDEMNLPDFCVKLFPITCHTPEELYAYEAACLMQGYEGVCVRTGDSPYKLGRSTLKEQWLVKIKRFIDGEATVIDTYEKFHNANPAERDATGAQVRATDAAGMVPTGVLGGVQVRDLKSQVEFNIGSGFNDHERASLWQERQALVGRIAKYRTQPHGAHERPRFPTFLGWRHPADLST